MSDPLDRLGPLERLEVERLQERSDAYRTRPRGSVLPDDEPEQREPLTTEERLESFFRAAHVVHLEPGLDEEHTVLAQLVALRERFIADVARDPEDELAWIAALPDDALERGAAVFAEHVDEL